MGESGLSNCEKFYLILWRDFCVQWNNRIRMGLAIVMPLLFTIIAISIRVSTHVKNEPVATYNPIDFQLVWSELIKTIEKRSEILNSTGNYEYNYFVPRPVLAFSPNTQEAFRKIMEKASIYLQDIELKGFTDGRQMRESMQQEYYLAGVAFDDINPKTSEVKGIYPQQLTYALVFPSELRYYTEFYIGSDWNTEMLFDVHNTDEQRFSKLDDGGFVGYIREGFISLQHAVSFSYIELLGNTNDIPPITMQRFPYREHVVDRLIQAMSMSLSFLINVGFLYPCMYMTTVFMRDKETHMKEMTKLMGINFCIQTFGCFINGLITFIPASLLLMISLKIHWEEGYAICSKSSWLALLCFLIVYNLSSICFCFMVSSFFDRNSSALLVVGLAWFISYLPYIFIKTSAIRTAFHIQIPLCFFVNTAMGIAFQHILEFEYCGLGFTWNSFFDSDTINDEMTVGVVTLILLGLCIPYTLIGLYVEQVRPGLYGVAKPWYYVFRRCRRRTSRMSMDIRATRAFSILRMTKVFEIEPEYKHITVEVQGLQKKVNDQMLVNNVSMNLFDGEITVIMGHNGSGKTTLLSMCIGLSKPTRGTVRIHGYDIARHMNEAREFLGICVQQNILFQDLTVFNQLNYYCRIKGLSKEDTKSEVSKYLTAMKILGKSHVVIRDLTEDKRRQLSVCCALCGDSKFVVLDEPSTGMDLNARKLLWELLISEKKNRTILLTTHSTEEADFLADRIGIMSAGELKCFGSSFFLRKVYGIGYRLVCVKDYNCDADIITQVMRKYVPDIMRECEIGTELTYKLEEKHALTFADILAELESRLAELRIQSCSIYETTVEDLFLAMGAEDPSDGDRVRHAEIMNGISIYSDEYEQPKFLTEHSRVIGLRLCVNHWRAMLQKRFIFNRRADMLLTSQLFGPIIFVIAVLIIMILTNSPTVMEPITFRLTQYTESITVLTVLFTEDNPILESIVEKYRGLIFFLGLKHKIEINHDMLFHDYIINKQHEFQQRVSKQYLVAATISNTNIIAWFNNYPIHTAPLSLNLVHNAILHTLLDQNFRIIVTLDPLPFGCSHRSDDMRSATSDGTFMVVWLTICIAYIWSTSIIFFIKERQSNFKLLQFVSGVRGFIFWMASFVYDIIRVTLVSLLIVITVLCVEHDNFIQMEIMCWYSMISLIYLISTIFFVLVSFFSVLVFFGVCITPLTFLVSYLFNNHIFGFCMLVVFNMFGTMLYFAFLEIFDPEQNHILSLSGPKLWACCVFPHFSLSSALLKLYTIGKIRHLCADRANRLVSVYIEKCTARPNCCDENYIFTWKVNGIFAELSAMTVIGVLSFISLLLIEQFKNNSSLPCTRIPEDNDALLQEDYRNWNSVEDTVADEVILEKLQVESLKSGAYQQKALLLKHVGKQFNKIPCVKRISLAIERCECFGLLGVNGSGKSTLIKMLVGDVRLSYGRAYISGISIVDNLYSTYKHIGYCPQIVGTINEYTGRELMSIYCLLRGIPLDKVVSICEALAKVLGYMAHYDKKLMYYSMGNKRRLSVAIALLGNPRVVYLDEPSSGIDPAGRRQLWNIIGKVRNTGSAIVITSMSIRECERIATRLAVISNGRLQCLGTAESLNERYSKGYLLKIKIKRQGDHPEAVEYGELYVMSNRYLRVMTFVEKQFPNTILLDQRGNTMFFLVPLVNLSLSQVFKTMQRNTFNLNIESYTVTRATLTAVFIEMAESNEPRVSNISNDEYNEERNN